jgi:hypothetical protein
MSILYYWALVQTTVTLRNLETFNLCKREVWFAVPHILMGHSRKERARRNPTSGWGEGRDDHPERRHSKSFNGQIAMSRSLKVAQSIPLLRRTLITETGTAVSMSQCTGTLKC